MATANSRARLRGKAHERRLAKATGGKRSGATGLASPDVVGGVGGWLCIEAKSWSRPPTARIEQALAQAERAARDDQLAIAVVHETGRRSSRDLVIMRWADFDAWFGDEPSHGEVE